MPSTILDQAGAELLAGMLTLTDLRFDEIDLRAHLDNECAWKTLELTEFPSLRTIEFLPLRLAGGGLRFSGDNIVYVNWELDAASSVWSHEDVVIRAVESSASSAVVGDALVVRHNAQLHVRLAWDEMPDLNPRHAVAVVAALAPWASFITGIFLDHWYIDESVTQAIKIYLPLCNQSWPVDGP